MPNDSSNKPRKIKPEGADGHRQRMMTKFLNSYDKDFYQRDLVEILLYYAIRVQDTRDTAVRLMRDNGNDIYNILNASPEKLCETEGVGPACATLLKTVGAIVNRSLCGNNTDSVPNNAENKPYSFTIDTLLERAKNDESDRIYTVFHDSADQLSGYKSLLISMSNEFSSDIFVMLKHACLTHSYGVSIIRSTSSNLSVLPMDMELLHTASKALSLTDSRFMEYYIVKGSEMLKIKNMYM